MLNCHSFKPIFKDSTPSSTWQHSTIHLKYYSYHICYSNLDCLSSLKNELQGAYACQILSSTLKPVRSYVTKPEKVYEIPLKFQVPDIIPTHFHSFKSTTNIQSTLPFSTMY